MTLSGKNSNWRWIMSFILLTLCIETFGQQNNIVELSDLLRSIFQKESILLRYENTTFVDDIGLEDLDFRKALRSMSVEDSAGYHISKAHRIEFINCSFEKNLAIDSIIQHGPMLFKFPTFKIPNNPSSSLMSGFFGSKKPNIRFRFNLIDSLVIEENEDYSLFVQIKNSEIKYLDAAGDKFDLTIDKSIISQSYQVLISGSSSLILDSSTLYGSDIFGNIYLDNIDFVRIDNCTFRDSDFVGELGAFFCRLHLQSNEVYLTQNAFELKTSIELYNRIHLTKNKFSDELAINISSLEKVSYIDKVSLNNFDFGYLAFLNNSDSKSVYGGYYDGSKKEEFENESSIRSFVRVCKELYDHFKETGDMRMANAAYARMREVEYNRYQNEHEAAPSVRTFFNLNLDRLLRFYTTYGTDPVKAIIISFYTIICFGIFYFFFPSDWDTKSKGVLIQNFRDFTQKNDKGYLKPFLQLVKGFLISLFNALTLSLNAFTTLGFGNIPTHGIARYVCVFQGFLGWFLLSIFIVALINQVQF